MRKPWNINWVRRGDITGGFALAIAAALYTLYILIVAAGYLLAGIFLLGRWLIRRHRANRRLPSSELTAMDENSRAVKAQPTAHITVQFLDEEVHVAYRADRITPEMWDVASTGVSGADDELCAKFLSRLLVAWDVTKGGMPYPTTQESLQALPAVFLKSVFAQILIDSEGRDRALSSN